MTSWTRRLALAVGALAVAACGGNDPVPQAGATGQDVFAANCATCHGPAAQGTDEGPPLVHQVYEPSHHSDDAFRTAVAQGVAPHHWEFGPMPPIRNVDAGQVDEIIRYVRGLQREAGIE